MVWFTYRRKQKKLVKSILQEARHARHMREDVASPDQIARLTAQEGRVVALARGQETGDIEAEAHRLLEITRSVFPIRPHPKLRENLEVALVAIAVAMGIRTYFVQPFRIPTGSMQPTLYGITVQSGEDRQWYERLPFSVVPLALFGERYEAIRAKASGTVRVAQDLRDDWLIEVGGSFHRIRKSQNFLVEKGEYVQQGQVLAQGRVRLGDHILVNRMAYNFRRPRRGDIIVFSTAQIDHPRINPRDFYIKRLVGLPGERIQIDPPVLLADGAPVLEPLPFRRQAERDGLLGYQLVEQENWGIGRLNRAGDHIDLGTDDYLPMGDNTGSSLDGRYFGPVKNQAILGPAFGVYWPLTPRWGRVD